MPAALKDDRNTVPYVNNRSSQSHSQRQAFFQKIHKINVPACGFNIPDEKSCPERRLFFTKNTQSLGNFYIFLHAAPNAVYNS